MNLVPNEILAVLRRGGLLELGGQPAMEPLKGGVSSDIWWVELEGGEYCVKRALPKLRVAADWRAPVERNSYEAAWMSTVAGIVPDAVPPLVHSDAAGHALVMPFFDPAHYQVWKTKLLDGTGQSWTATLVAQRLARIHQVTAGDPTIANQFKTDRIFHDIRLEPYLLATATHHPRLATILADIAAQTARTKLALVHGDISPKNILVGQSNIVFLDAECAWYGDPAFDLAFCLNHFLLKSAHKPEHALNYLGFFETMAATYLDWVNWEDRDLFERRCARLLPGLLLGRIDGRSPVEYITEDDLKDSVRQQATNLLEQPMHRLAGISNVWLETFAI